MTLGITLGQMWCRDTLPCTHLLLSRPSTGVGAEERDVEESGITGAGRQAATPALMCIFLLTAVPFKDMYLEHLVSHLVC